MSRAFVDTTIIADILLQSGERKVAAQAALGRFSSSELPVYAIKEFKAGPLRNFVWFHNKLALLKSFQKAVAVLHSMSLTPRRYTTATALQALHAALQSAQSQTYGMLVTKYGRDAHPDTVMCDRFRLTLKRKIISAWRRRRSITTNVVLPLICYEEVDPIEVHGILDVTPTRCEREPICSMTKALKSEPNNLTRLKRALEKNSNKRERQRQIKLLRKLIRNKWATITDSECRTLGDVVFAFFAPEDAVILTTNISDHKLLADALAKKVEAPN